MNNNKDDMMHKSTATNNYRKQNNFKRSFAIFLIIFSHALIFSGNKAQASDSQIGIVKTSTPDFYVSPSGNDNNNGTSSSTPWRSLQKVNSTNFSSGTVVAFERGGEWYGQLRVTRPDLTITAYGNGSKPIIHGWKTLTGWKSEGNGIYSITDSGLPNRLGVLTINGSVQNMGRFPKKGWWRVNSGSGSSSGSITSTDLSGQPNFTGGELVISKNAWALERGNITGHSGTTINFSGLHKNYEVRKDYGFFVQNHINCLSQFGDWSYNNSTKKLYMFFGSENTDNHEIKVSTLDYVLYLDGNSPSNAMNFHIDNLSFQGSNLATIYCVGSNARDGVIQNCDVLKSGTRGIQLDSRQHGFTFINNLVEDSKSMGLETSGSSNLTISNNVFRRTALDQGGLQNTVKAGGAIVISPANWVNISNITITGNKIYDTGYNGMSLHGSNLLVEKNIVKRYNLSMIDGAGIYIGNNAPGETPNDNYTNRIIRNNIVSNPDYQIPILGPYTHIGVEDGFGIYMDDRSINIECIDNILYDNYSGIYVHNARDLNIRRNIIYNPRGPAVWMHDDGIATGPEGTIQNINFQNNVIYALGSAYIMSVLDRFDVDGWKDFGTINNNHYLKPTGVRFIRARYSRDPWVELTFQQWKTNHKLDLNTKSSPTTSSVSALYYNDSNQTKVINVGKNRIDINGNPITNPSISFEPFTGMIVLEGEAADSQPDPEDQSWILNTTTTGQGSITKNPNKSQYNNNESVQLTAVPQDGWEFAGWSGDLTGSTNPVNIDMTKNINITAIFREIPAPASYTVAFTVISSTGSAISNAVVTFNGITNPAGNYTFTDVASGTYNYTISAPGYQNISVSGITVNQSMTVPVTMTPEQQSLYTVTFNILNSAIQPVNNAIITLNGVSNPAGNYVFNNIVSGTYNYSVSAPGFNTISVSNLSVTQDMTVLVNLTTATQSSFAISTISSPEKGGSVSGNGTYQSGQTATLTSTPNIGYRFDNWTEGGNVVFTDRLYSFVVEENRSLVANFSLLQLNLTLVSNISDAGTLQGNGTYEYGQQVTIRATENTGFIFSHWAENGLPVSHQSEYTFVIEENKILEAVFDFDNRTVKIAAAANPPGFAFISGAGEYQELQNVEVSATPVDENYRFVGWVENGRSVSNQNPYNFQASRSRNIEARFVYEPREFKVEATVNLAGSAEISGLGNYAKGQIAELQVVTHENIAFIGWRNSAGQIVSRQNPYTVEVNRDIELQAIVEIKSSLQIEDEFQLKVYPNPSDGVFYSNLEEESELEIFNSNGLLIQKRHVGPGQNPINLTELPAGIYVLKFHVDDEILTQKVLIR